MKPSPIIAALLALAPVGLAEQPQGFTTLDFPGAVLTEARGINPQGDIVGSYQDATGYHGFLLSGGAWTSIKIAGAVRVRPQSINASGEIAGQYIDVNGKWRGLLVSEGSLSTIDPPGATGASWSGAYGINPQGEVVGLFSDPTGVRHGYLLREGVFTPLPDAVEGSRWSSPAGMNARGDIVGMYVIPGDPKMYGYLLRKGMFTKLDVASATTMACALAINEAGVIVGHYFDTSLHGFVFSNGIYTAVDIPGAVSTEILGINARGDMVGDYTDAAGKVHGFLLSRGAPK